MIIWLGLAVLFAIAFAIAVWVRVRWFRVTGYTAYDVILPRFFPSYYCLNGLGAMTVGAALAAFPRSFGYGFLCLAIGVCLMAIFIGFETKHLVVGSWSARRPGHTTTNHRD